MAGSAKVKVVRYLGTWTVVRSPNPKRGEVGGGGGLSVCITSVKTVLIDYSVQFTVCYRLRRWHGTSAVYPQRFNYLVAIMLRVASFIAS